MWWGTLSSL
jgi:hypothetical protein